MTENTTTSIPAELEQRAEAGDAKAQFELACYYAAFCNAEPNEELAFMWLTKSAENGLANAQLALGYAYCNRTVMRDQLSDNTRDKEWMQSRVVSGPYVDEPIPFFVGFGPANRRAGDDPALAFLWFRKSADQGDPEALYWIGRCYEFGIGVGQNDGQAFEAYKKAADQGFGLAFEKVAQCYFKGQGVKQDDIQAADWYLKASTPWSIDLQLFEGSDSATQWLIDRRYPVALRYFERGEYKHGMSWIMNAVMDGNNEACNWPIGAYLSLTLPNDTDKENEEKFFSFAFNGCRNELNGVNAPEAYLLLGVLYLSGRGVEQNHERAFKCFLEADQINGEPQEGGRNEWLSSFIRMFLLICLVQGKGTEKDLETAKKHLSFIEYDFEAVGRILVKGLNAMSIERMLNNRLFIDNLIFSFYFGNKEYERAEQHIKNSEDEDAMGAYVKKLCLDKIERDKKLTEANEKLLEKEKELEETMAMFAHKFRSPLDAIIYNTEHEHQEKLYKQAAQTMRGLLDIFSMIATDSETLVPKIQQDSYGSGRLATVLERTLDMILLHLLSAPAAAKIQQHYLRYAKAHGLCDAELSDRVWKEEYFELERQLQVDWEHCYAQLLADSATLEQRLDWLEQRFFKLEVRGFERSDIQFREYGDTESLLTIVLNEILVNAFKYYASPTRQPVVLEWLESDHYQLLRCQNPSQRNERNKLKGSRKGHVFLSSLARKTASEFSKPKVQDAFVLEFGFASELLISS